MIPQTSPVQIAIVLLIALLVFGPRRLPDLGRSLGEGINGFREGLQNLNPDRDQDKSGPGRTTGESRNRPTAPDASADPGVTATVTSADRLKQDEKATAERVG